MFRWPAGAAAELEVDGLGRFTMGMREGRPCAHWKGKAVAARRARRLAPCAGVRPVQIALVSQNSQNRSSERTVIKHDCSATCLRVDEVE